MIAFWGILLGGLMANASTVRNVDFGKNKLDLFLPDGKPAPLVVFVHGGAWVSGEKEQYSRVGEELTKAGLAAAVTEYSLTSKAAPVRHPKPVEELAAAIDWLVAEAPKRGFIGDKITVVGHSAGAHMAATLCFDSAFAATAKKVDRYVGISGIYDLPALVKRFPDYRDWFVTLAFGDAAKWRAASPIAQPLKTSAKWRVVHSPGDELVDIAQSEAFYAALKKAGTSADFVKLGDGVSHFGSIPSTLDAGQLAFYRY